MTARTSGSRVFATAVGSLQTAWISDRGTVRRENQDRAAIVPLAEPGACALILADGMGGAAGGGDAAEAAMVAAAGVLEAGSAGAASLAVAVAAASTAVGRVRDRIGGGPGTTLLIAVVETGRATIANLGDGRGYRITSGRADRLTTDHSVAEAEMLAGRLTAADARTDPRRNHLTRAVLGDDERADIGVVHLRGGDTLLLCTDGLWEPLSDDRIGAIMGEEGPLEELLVRLCDSALAAGSRDNLSAIALR